MRWNGWVDEELRRGLLARAEEDQRMRRLAPPPKGQYVVRLPDEIAQEWRRHFNKLRDSCSSGS